jgi:hypothetical protein
MREGRVEDQRRHAGGEGFERRDAEAFVVREKCEHTRGSVRIGQVGVAHVVPPFDTIADASLRRHRRRIDRRVGPVVADEDQPGVVHEWCGPREALNEIRNVPAREQRSDVENHRLARGGRGGCGGRLRGGRRQPDAVARHAQPPDDLAGGEL